MLNPGTGLRLVRLMQGILRESKKEKKKRGGGSSFVECKVFFEFEFIGFEVYCIVSSLLLKQTEAMEKINLPWVLIILHLID